MDATDVEKLPAKERAQFVEVKRDLRKMEISNRQILLYAPCGCGSGKKFKFCCHRKV
jgi:uncharacterized protein YchJ